MAEPGPQTTRAAAPAGAADPTAAPTADPKVGSTHDVVSVLDGDTIKVMFNGRRETVRLIGIDAPESKKPGVAVQCFSQKSASKMQSMVQSRTVRLVADPTQADRDRFGRLLRHVFQLDGRNVALELIGGGYGREFTYSRAYAGQSTYRAAEQTAKAAHAGLWGECGGVFPVPVPVPVATAAPAPTQPRPAPGTPNRTSAPRPPAVVAPVAPKPSGACTIKGNINGEGEKIYHLPGQQFYDKTVISPKKGERMFCSESDAVNAGWRAAKI